MHNSDHRSSNGNPAAGVPFTSCNLLSNVSVEAPVECTDPLWRYSLRTPLSKRSYRLPSSIRLEQCTIMRTLQTATLPSQGVSCRTIQVVCMLYKLGWCSHQIRKGLKREVQLVQTSSRQQLHFPASFKD